MPGQAKTGGGSKRKGNNATGRPKKGEALSEILRTKLDSWQDDKDPESGKTKRIQVKQAIIGKIVSLALEGDLSALRYIFDRLEGSPIHQTSNDPHDMASFVLNFGGLKIPIPKDD